jgi:hypothetical protein
MISPEQFERNLDVSGTNQKLRVITKMKNLKMISALVVAIGITSSVHGASNPLMDTKVARESTIERLLGMFSLNSTATKKMGERIVDREPPECYEKDGAPVYSYRRCLELERAATKPGTCPRGGTYPECQRLMPCDARYCPEPEPGPG